MFAMLKSFVLALVVTPAASDEMGRAVKLDIENYDRATVGKTALIHFCGSKRDICLKAIREWEEITELTDAGRIKVHEDVLLGTVDCDDGPGSSQFTLCKIFGVNMLPAIKYGDPHNLEEYYGNWTFSAIRQFVEGVKPDCIPDGTSSLCSNKELNLFAEWQSLNERDLKDIIFKKERAVYEAKASMASLIKMQTDKFEELRSIIDDAVLKISTDITMSAEERDDAINLKRQNFMELLAWTNYANEEKKKEVINVIEAMKKSGMDKMKLVLGHRRRRSLGKKDSETVHLKRLAKDDKRVSEEEIETIGNPFAKIHTGTAEL